MNSRWERLRWRVALAAGTLLVWFALMGHEGTWAWLGIEHYDFYFLDTIAVLSAGQAWHAGLDIYDQAKGNPFDPFGRPHVYGPWWLLTGPLGLTIADARWLGPLVGLAFIVSAVAVLAPRRPGPAAIALLLLASPPVLLALERGNNDLVVFVLLVLAGELLTRPRQPAANGAALAARPAQRRAALAWMGAVGGGCLLVFLLWHTDYTRALAIAPRPRSIFAYGVKVLAWMWDWPGPTAMIWLAVVFGVVAAGAGVWLLRRAAALWAAVPPTGAVTAWFVAAASAWCFCYLVNSNYLYRATLLLLPARLWLDQTDGTDRRAAGTARALLAACVVMVWLLPVKSWCASRLGLRPWADLGLAVILGVEQALVAAVTAALLISLTGWGWRRWREVRPPADSASRAAPLSCY